MISVDNFYWILHERLLRPCKLHTWYYFPHGTQQGLAHISYLWPANIMRQSRTDLSHVLFHFDQEPIYDESLGRLYDQETHNGNGWTFYNFAKFLANSERSQIKKDICQKRHFLDWYYFYHGFAALDWFRDTQRLEDRHMIDNAYLCFNHLTTHRKSYRISLIARLLDRKCTHTGRISFHGNITGVCDELANPDTRLSSTSKKIIRENLHDMIGFPWTIDRATGSGEMSAHLDMHDYALWQKSFMHIVTESIFYEPKLHLTEKIFKPIVAFRPFILVAAPGNLAYLKEYGFKTFDHWIDEKYDKIQDHDERLDAVVSEIFRLQNLPISELSRILAEMRPVLAHNQRHFFGAFREIIVDELVDNFDRCIRIWNNGRVDDRSLARHPDLDTVKQILL